MWGRLGKLLQREGMEPEVSEKLYHTVVQAVLLFGVETWVLLAPMMKSLEEENVSFLRQVKLKHAMGQRDESWWQVTT